MMKSLCHALLVCVVCVAPVALAQELQVVTEDWRPYNYLEDGEIKGVSTNIVNQVLDQAGVSYTTQVYPWARAYNMALSNPNTIIYTLIRIPQRENLFKWIRPLGKGGTTSLYRLKSRATIQPKTVDEAKQYRIVANLNSMDHQWLQDNGFTHLETPPKVENSLRMFFKGDRVDLLAFDDSVLEDEFNRFGFNTRDVVKVLPLFKTPPYMAASHGTPDAMVERLQKAYDSLMTEKKIKLVN